MNIYRGRESSLFSPEGAEMINLEDDRMKKGEHIIDVKYIIMEWNGCIS